MKTSNNGWILIHRSIISWEWWDDLPTRNLFFYCLLSANHKDEIWHGIKIPRGSFATSYDALSKGTGFSVKQMRRAVLNLKNTGELGTQRAGNWAILTINNYDKYQDVTDVQGQTLGNKKADFGQTLGSKRATNKEDKEIKEIEEDINNNKYNPLLFPPSFDDVAAFCRMRNNYVDPEEFLDYYKKNNWTYSNGKKSISDWHKAIYTWEKEDRKNGKIPPPKGVKLGKGEYMRPDGTRTYADGTITIPLDARPRPGEYYFWNAQTKDWCY